MVSPTAKLAVATGLSPQLHFVFCHALHSKGSLKVFFAKQQSPRAKPEPNKEIT